jgi:hypothetical protein
MGKLINGIYGPIQGKVGPIVGSSWKGISYIKAKPKFRTKRRGIDEKKNHNKFAAAHYWLQPIINFLREGFKGYSPTVEGFNAAKSYNLKNAFINEGDVTVIEPSLVRVSSVDLPLPGNININKADDFLLEFNWDTSLQSHTNRQDQVMLLAYDPVNKTNEMILTGQFRITGSDTLQLEKKKGLSYHIYLAFTAHDRSRQSMSVYLGKIDT